jgi:tetratricopeptide (TPR) repeat protein
MIYGNRGEYNRKIQCYKKILEIDPKSRTAWKELGWAYEKLGKPDEAKKYFDKAAEF